MRREKVGLRRGAVSAPFSAGGTGSGTRRRIIAIVAFLLVHSWCWVGPAGAQEGSPSPRWLIWPSGAAAFPTGRFGETIKEPPPKPGHKTGATGALDLGYFVSRRLALGVAADFTWFPMNISDPLDPEGSTVATVGQIWGRYFLPGGYAHWQPYILLGVGAGRLRGSIDYRPAAIPIDTFSVTRITSTVNTAFAATAGLGVQIPIGPRLGFLFEPCYRSMSTQGRGRTDELHLVDGSTVKSKHGSENGQPFRLKDKANTNWWEIRFGLAITLP